MKKMRLFLVAAFLIGVGSAFTSPKKALGTTGYGSENGSTWYEVNTDDIGDTYDCVEGPAKCLYQSDHVTPLPNQPDHERFIKLDEK